MKFGMQRFMIYLILLTVQDRVFVADAPAIYFSALDLSTQTFTFDSAGSYAFANNLSYNYQPTAVSTGSPMVKVTASNISIDFSNNGIYNNPETPHQGWIGVEVGWSPAQLAADPTLVQPSNITISNLNLYNFDCNILIHQGVQQILIQNCNFFNASYGIIILGTPKFTCNDLELNDVSIFGHRQNYHDALVNMKTLINTTYGYGTDFFMKLGKDPLDNNTQDVYAYIGVWANYLLEGKFTNLLVQNLGYANYATASEGNGNRTAAVGMRLKNSKRMVMKDVSCTEISSEVNAVGLQLDGVSEIVVDQGEFSYCMSSQRAVGVDVTNQSNSLYSIQAINFTNVSAKGNLSDALAIGMNLSAVYGFMGDNLQIKFNKGGTQTYGIYSTGMNTVNILNSTYSQNMSSSTSNTVASTPGVTVAAFWGSNIQLMQQTNCNFSSCTALNSAYGLFLQNSSSCQFFDCGFTGNSAQMMRSGEAAAIRAEQDAQEISKHGPVVEAASTGAYGSYIQGSKYIRFDGCVFNSNSGHRAVGCYLNNCQAIILEGSFASTQTATGLMFDNSIMTDLASNPSAIPVMPAHKSLLFGNSSVSTVDGLTTTDTFLKSASNIRASQIAGNQPAYLDVIGMCATSLLMQSAIARYRLWSIAAGVFGYNVFGLTVSNCTMSGQASLFDSSFGVCITGRSLGCNVINSNMQFNVASYVSQQTPAQSPTATYKHQYNLIGLSVFWSMLTSSIASSHPISGASSADAVGIFVDAIPTFRAQGSPVYGNLAAGDNVSVNLKGTAYSMISPVGPIAAGILLGDLVMEGIIENNIMSSSIGNSGHSYGILLDNAFSLTLEKNVISGNVSNIYGLTAGILDVTASCQNLFIANFLEGNKCSTFNNSNYFVPFNPADPNSLTFPVTHVMNGKFANKTTELDNLAVDYSQDPSFYSIDDLSTSPIHPDLLSYLHTNNCYA